MHVRSTNLVRLALPLLAHPDPEVARQAYTLLLSAYGEGVAASLRRLAQDADGEVRRQAQLATGQTAMAPIMEDLADTRREVRALAAEIADLRTLLAALPPVVVYAFLMDYYVAGLTAGATKG